MSGSMFFEALRVTARDTDQAIYIQHPNQRLKFIFLPRSEVISMTKKDKGFWSIEIPNWLAEDKDIF